MSIGKQSNLDPARRSPRRQPPGALAVLGALAVVACALAGCGRAPQAKSAARPAGSGRPATSPAPAMEIQEDPVKTGIEAGDASLASKVRGRLAGDPRLRASRIEVDAEAGRVTLWGHVASVEERAAAEQQARRTPGVTAVINLIKVDS
jgi:osmotically-inducible protein OsmY